MDTSSLTFSDQPIGVATTKGEAIPENLTFDDKPLIETKVAMQNVPVQYGADKVDHKIDVQDIDDDRKAWLKQAKFVQEPEKWQRSFDVLTGNAPEQQDDNIFTKIIGGAQARATQAGAAVGTAAILSGVAAPAAAHAAGIAAVVGGVYGAFEGGFEKNMNMYFDEQGMPQPLKYGEKPPPGSKIESAFGLSQGETSEDDNPFTTLGKSFANSFMGIGKALPNVANVLYGLGTGKDSKFLNEMSSVVDAQSFTKSSAADEEWVKVDAFESVAEFMNGDNWNFTPQNFMALSGQVVGSMAQFVGGAQLFRTIGATTKGAPVANTLGNRLLQNAPWKNPKSWALASAINLEESVKAADLAGLEGRDRHALSLMTALGMGALEIGMGGIELSLAGKKAIAKEVAETFATRATKDGLATEITGETIEGLWKQTLKSGLDKLARTGKSMVKSGIGEMNEEVTQALWTQSLQQLYDKFTGYKGDGAAGSQGFGTHLFNPESMQELFINGLGGVLGGIFGGAVNPEKQEKSLSRIIFDHVREGKTDQLRTELAISLKGRPDLQQSANFRIDAYERFNKETKDLVKKVTPDQRREIFELSFQDEYAKTAIAELTADIKANGSTAIKEAKLKAYNKLSGEYVNKIANILSKPGTQDAEAEVVSSVLNDDAANPQPEVVVQPVVKMAKTKANPGKATDPRTETIPKTEKNDINKEIFSIVATEDNYNSWSNVRDHSDDLQFSEAVNFAINALDNVPDKSKVTEAVIDDFLKSQKVTAKKDIREKIVPLIYKKIMEKFVAPETKKEAPKAEIPKTEIPNVEDEHIDEDPGPSKYTVYKDVKKKKWIVEKDGAPVASFKTQKFADENAAKWNAGEPVPVTEPEKTDYESLAPEEKGFEMKVTGKVKAVYNRVAKKFQYFNKKGREILSHKQHLSYARKITNKTVKTWWDSLADKKQKNKVREILDNYQAAVTRAENSKGVTTPRMILMLALSKAKLNRSWKKDLTDVSDRWFVKEGVKGAGLDVIVKETIEAYYDPQDESDLTNLIDENLEYAKEIIQEYPNGITQKDLDDEVETEMMDLYNLESDFLSLSGLDLNEAQPILKDLINEKEQRDEPEDSDSGTSEVQEDAEERGGAEEETAGEETKVEEEQEPVKSEEEEEQSKWAIGSLAAEEFLNKAKQGSLAFYTSLKNLGIKAGKGTPPKQSGFDPIEIAISAGFDAAIALVKLERSIRNAVKVAYDRVMKEITETAKKEWDALSEEYQEQIKDSIWDQISKNLSTKEAKAELKRIKTALDKAPYIVDDEALQELADSVGMSLDEVIYAAGIRYGDVNRFDQIKKKVRAMITDKDGKPAIEGFTERQLFHEINSYARSGMVNEDDVRASYAAMPNKKLGEHLAAQPIEDIKRLHNFHKSSSVSPFYHVINMSDGGMKPVLSNPGNSRKAILQLLEGIFDTHEKQEDIGNKYANLKAKYDAQTEQTIRSIENARQVAVNGNSYNELTSQINRLKSEIPAYKGKEKKDAQKRLDALYQLRDDVLTKSGLRKAIQLHFNNDVFFMESVTGIPASDWFAYLESYKKDQATYFDYYLADITNSTNRTRTALGQFIIHPSLNYAKFHSAVRKSQVPGKTGTQLSTLASVLQKNDPDVGLSDSFDDVNGKKTDSFSLLSTLILRSNEISDQAKNNPMYADNPVVQDHRDKPLVRANTDGLKNNKSNEAAPLKSLSPRDLQIMMISNFLYSGTEKNAGEGNFFLFYDQQSDSNKKPLFGVRKHPVSFFTKKKMEGILTEAEAKNEYLYWEKAIRAYMEAGMLVLPPGQTVEQVAKEYVLNYAWNKYWLDDYFRGNIENSIDPKTGKPSLRVQVKRKIDNTGEQLNLSETEGIGKTRQEAILTDFDFEGTKFADGQIIILPKFNKKIEKASGNIYGGLVKSTYFKIHDDKSATFVKGNSIVLPDASNTAFYTKYPSLRILLEWGESHGLDTIVFDSAAKIIDDKLKNPITPVNGVHFDKNSLPKKPIITEADNKFYLIQQDLTNDGAMKRGEMTSQFLYLIKQLPNAKEIERLFANAADVAKKKFKKEFESLSEEDKKQWFFDRIPNTDRNFTLKQYLATKGSTLVGNPFRRVLDGIVASEIEKNILGIPVFKNVNILVSLPGIDLKPARIESGKVRAGEIILPHGAAEQVEIGEWVLTIYVPSDDLHAFGIHTVVDHFPAEMKNAVQISRQHTKIGGKDFDADSAHTISKWKDENGEFVAYNDGWKGMINKALDLVKQDFEKVENFKRITTPIDTNAINPAIEKYRKQEDKLNKNLPSSMVYMFNSNRQSSIVKGMSVNLIKVRAYLAAHGAYLSTPFRFPLYKNGKPTGDFIELSDFRHQKELADRISEKMGNNANHAMDDVKLGTLTLMGKVAATSNIFDLIHTMAESEELTQSVIDFMHHPVIQEYIELYDEMRSPTWTGESDIWRVFNRRYPVSENGEVTAPLNGAPFQGFEMPLQEALNGTTNFDKQTVLAYFRFLEYVARDIGVINTFINRNEKQIQSFAEKLSVNDASARVKNEIKPNGQIARLNVIVLPPTNESKGFVSLSESKAITRGDTNEELTNQYYSDSPLNSVVATSILDRIKASFAAAVGAYAGEKIGLRTKELTKEQNELFEKVFFQFLAVQGLNITESEEELAQKAADTIKSLPKDHKVHEFIEVLPRSNKVQLKMQIGDLRNAWRNDQEMFQMGPYQKAFASLTQEQKDVLLKYHVRAFGFTAATKKLGGFFSYMDAKTIVKGAKAIADLVPALNNMSNSSIEEIGDQILLANIDLIPTTEFDDMQGYLLLSTNHGYLPGGYYPRYVKRTERGKTTIYRRLKPQPNNIVLGQQGEPQIVISAFYRENSQHNIDFDRASKLPFRPVTLIEPSMYDNLSEEEKEFLSNNNRRTDEQAEEEGRWMDWNYGGKEADKKDAIAQNFFDGYRPNSDTSKVHTIRPEITKKYGKGVKTITLVKEGVRTRTTRLKGWMDKNKPKIGDFFWQVNEKNPNDKVLTRITAIYGKSDPRFKDNWHKEGWIDENFEYVKDYDSAIEFEVIPSTDSTVSKTPVFNSLPSPSGTPTMTYAGIGSRQTPPEVLALMTKAAAYLEGLGFTLNTGKTFGNKEEGADKAFSDGTKKKNLFAPEQAGKKEIEVAKEIHPAPDMLSPGGMKLMARNTNQIFGEKLDTPVDFVLFWAKEVKGSIRPEGGTGQAVEMARRKGIPTINMADKNWREQLKEIVAKKGAIQPSSEPITARGLEAYESVTVLYKSGTRTATRTWTNIVADTTNPDLLHAKDSLRPEDESRTFNVKNIIKIVSNGPKYQKASSEPLAYMDPVLQEKIRVHLHKMFPGLVMFSNAAAFQEYLDKQGNGFVLDNEALGAEIDNVYWINPEKAVQSSEMHEIFHKYLDLIPDSDPKKRMLIKLFGSERATIDAVKEMHNLDEKEAIDESIVTDVAKEAFRQAKIKMGSIKWHKFKEALRKFWVRLKLKVWGNLSKEEYVSIMADDFWNNKHELDLTATRNNLINYMKGDLSKDQFLVYKEKEDELMKKMKLTRLDAMVARDVRRVRTDEIDVAKDENLIYKLAAKRFASLFKVKHTLKEKESEEEEDSTISRLEPLDIDAFTLAYTGSKKWNYSWFVANGKKENVQWLKTAYDIYLAELEALQSIVDKHPDWKSIDAMTNDDFQSMSKSLHSLETLRKINDPTLQVTEDLMAESYVDFVAAHEIANKESNPNYTLNKPWTKAVHSMAMQYESKAPIQDWSSMKSILSGTFGSQVAPFHSPISFKESPLQLLQHIRTDGMLDVKRNIDVHIPALRTLVANIKKKGLSLETLIYKKSGVRYFNQAYKTAKLDPTLVEFMDYFVALQQEYSGLSSNEGSFWMVPEVLMDWPELISTYSSSEALFVKLTDTNNFDDLHIEDSTGKVMTLKKAREEIEKSRKKGVIGALVAAKKLDKLIGQAREMYENESTVTDKAGLLIIRTPEQRMAVGASFGQTKYTSRNTEAALVKYFHQQIFKSVFERKTLLMKGIEVYYDENGAERDTKSIIAQYVKQMNDYLLYNIEPKSRLGHKVDMMIEWMNTWTVWKFLGLNLVGAGFNLSAGITQNIRELGLAKTMKGITRFRSGIALNASFDRGFIENDIVRFMNKFGIVNISRDMEISPAGAMMERVKRVIFAPITYVEYINHGITIAGLLTDEEWKEYQDSVKENRELSIPNDIIQRYIDQSERIHGPYMPLNKRPINRTAFGRMVMALKNWMPEVVLAHFEDEYTDMHDITRKGILTSAGGKDMLDLYKSVFTSPGSVTEKWNALPEIDKLNMGKLMREAVMMGLFGLLFAAMKGDRERGKKITRIIGDIGFVYDMNNWQFLLASPVPAFKTAYDGISFLKETGKAVVGLGDRYETGKHKGLPKAGVLGLNMAPGNRILKDIIETTE